MAAVDEVPKTYDQAVRTLARWHGDEDGNGLEVYSIPDPVGQVIRLIEVSTEFPTADIRAFTFGSSADFPFKSSVIQITPTQWERLLRGELSLPADWNLDSRHKVLP